jgi:hypothetical protein
MLVLKSIPMDSDGKKHAFQIQGEEVDIGLNGNGEALYRITFTDNDINVYVGDRARVDLPACVGPGLCACLPRSFLSAIRYPHPHHGGMTHNRYWLNGSLTQWLEFSISLRVDLGLDHS